MNHLGDTNKMVETPRTDAHIDGLRRDPEVSGCDRTLNFCRQLERELNAANESFRKLNIHALNLVDRIRRLEEAGDEMEKYCRDYYSSNKWYKAKEAK